MTRLSSTPNTAKTTTVPFAARLRAAWQLGIPVILVIEVEGAGNIKKMYPGATTIFVLPPDMQELERRLRCRGTEDEETIQRRLKRAETEIANSVNYDEHVVNVEVDSCAESIYSIIQFKLQHGSRRMSLQLAQAAVNDANDPL